MPALKSTWISIIKSIRAFLGLKNKNEYVAKLVDHLEKLNEEDANIAFRITDIREHGFIVKVAGLFGYIAFNHMPWKYSAQEAWQAVFPHISGKVFFCKIYQIKKDPLLIQINGKVPQFREPELIEDDVYTGIIIHKVAYGAFIDIGYTFRWECGSIVGLLHKSNFENPESFEKTVTGQIIETTFLCMNEKDQLVFGSRTGQREWQTGEIFRLVGQTVGVEVQMLKASGFICLAAEKYHAFLPVTRYLYPLNLNQVKKAISFLETDEIIHCEVTGIDKSRKLVFLKWTLQSEIDSYASRENQLENTLFVKKRKVGKRLREQEIQFGKENNSIGNLLDKETIQKLKLLGK